MWNICVCLALLLPALAACNFTVQETPLDEGGLQTAAAQTIAADQKQQTIDAMQALLTAQALTLQAPSATPVPTDTQAPSDTPAPTDTQPAPVVPPTQEAPPPPQPIMLTADIETRCREGDNPAFKTISFIRAGQQAEVLGKNPAVSWWLIRDPQGTFGNCWVWGETTRLLGDANQVPVIQPPPLPTPVSNVSFSSVFANIHNCGGVAMAVFLVGNNGTVPFQSSSITIWDLTADEGLAGPENSNAPFIGNPGGCPPGNPVLPPGANAYVAKGMGFLPPAGTLGQGIIVLCTLPNLGGQCAEVRPTFTFP
jgi:hypothetical protein